MNPTGTIPTWFYDQFSATFLHSCQQTQSKLEPFVQVKRMTAEDLAMDEISTLSLRERTERHPTTVWDDPSTGRRWMNWKTYDGDVMIDKPDKLSMLTDPTSDYIRELTWAANRQKDDTIVTAAFAAVKTGRTYGSGSDTTFANTKYTGSNHTVQGLAIAHDMATHGGDGTSTSLTVPKLLALREIFEAKDCPEEEGVYLVVNPKQIWSGLMLEEEYRNIDYATKKALADGKPVNFCGVTLIPTTRISLGSSNDVDADTNVYRCIGFTSGGLALGVAQDINVQIATLPEHEFQTGVHIELGIGAVRIDEDKVVSVECA